MAITNFLDSYAEYTKDALAPKLFNEWCGIIGVAATIGRKLWISRGHFKVFPNLYVMLVGEPGSGKGVACSLIQELLLETDYEYFSADRSSKEKFLEDLADGLSFNKGSVGDLWEGTPASDLSNGSGTTGPRECFILAEEFQDFLGQNNLDFIAFLTKVWSPSKVPYRYRIKSGRSVSITDPTINLLGGITSQNFSLTFPPEIMGQGFLARLLLIGGDPPRERVSFPAPPDPVLGSQLSAFLGGMKYESTGEISIGRETLELLDKFNQEFGGVDDPRFKDYNIRRFTQLLKLCVINVASRCDRTIRISDIERANDILARTEAEMPRALGAFGKSRNADVTNKIIQALYQSLRPLTMKDLWKLVCDDLDKFEDLGDILAKLSHSERIQSVKGGYLPKIHVKEKK